MHPVSSMVRKQRSQWQDYRVAHLVASMVRKQRSQQQDHRTAYPIAFMVRKQRVMDAFAQLNFFLIQLRIPVHRMVSHTITVGLSTSINLINTISYRHS